MGFVGSLYSHYLLMFLVLSVGLPICTRLSSSAETTEYSSNVGDDRLILRSMTLRTSASASVSPRLLPSSVSAIFIMVQRRTLSVSRLSVLMLVKPLILPRLALVVCYETE
jgi:hypothetical protein